MRLFSILTVSLTLLVCTPNYAQTDEKPNVIFIMCDDLNDYQGVFGGNPQAITPSDIFKFAAPTYSNVN